MLPLPPKRMTFEHEASHAVVVRAGGGTVKYVDLNPEASGTTVSLARTEWKPPLGDQNLLLAGFVAGPAQTSITVARLGNDSAYIENSIACEAKDLARLLSEQRGTEPNVPGARALVDRGLSVMERYLSDPAVQSAVLAVADALEQAIANGESRVDWSDLEGLVDWNGLPTLPSLGS